MSKASKRRTFYDIKASEKANDTFGSLFESMACHPNFKKLTLSEKNVYILCRVQAQSRDGKSCLYNHAKAFGRTYDDCFVFPAEHMRKYGLERSNCCKVLSRLVEKGFLEKVECNKHIKKVNVYAFSDRWKNKT